MKAEEMLIIRRGEWMCFFDGAKPAMRAFFM